MLVHTTVKKPTSKIAVPHSLSQAHDVLPIEGEDVFVVDDDPQSRRSLELLLGSVHSRVEAFASAESFLMAYDASRWGCLVLDVRMPGMGGLELQDRLVALRAPLTIVMVTAHAEVAMAVRAVKAGALDFLEKPYSPQVLLEAVHRALVHQAEVRRRSQGLADFEQRLAALSPREAEVYDLLVANATTKAIAATLDISDKTVEVHRRNVCVKLGASSTAELARLVGKYEQQLASRGT